MFLLLGPTSILWNGLLVYSPGLLAFPLGFACILSHFSHGQLCATLRTVACQVSLSLRISRQEYWSGLPCPSPGESSQPRGRTYVLPSPALAGRFFTTSTIEALGFFFNRNASILRKLRPRGLFLN